MDDGSYSRDQLVERLERRILAGEPPPGSKLPSERELAEELSVSRPVVREVLRSLSERNLVDVVPGRGTYVRHARSGDALRPVEILLRRQQATARHLVEARKMLECEAAYAAALRAGADDLAAMDAALRGLAQSKGLLERTRFDVTFHASVVRAAHNPVIETMFAAIAGLTAELVLRSLSDPAVESIGLAFHDEIAQAIRRRDADAARAAMREHLSVAERTYGDDYDAPLDVFVERELGRFVPPEEILAGIPGRIFAPGQEVP